jgi:hypothetical protein
MTQTPEEPIDVQRVLMDRAKRLAEADHAPHERPLLPRLVGLGLALLTVVVVLFAFDRFLASVQRFLSLPITDPEPALTEPLPAYSVPAEEETSEDRAQPAEGQGAAQDAAPAVTPAETAPKP